MSRRFRLLSKLVHELENGVFRAFAIRSEPPVWKLQPVRQLPARDWANLSSTVGESHSLTTWRARIPWYQEDWEHMTRLCPLVIWVLCLCQESRPNNLPNLLKSANFHLVDFLHGFMLFLLPFHRAGLRHLLCNMCWPANAIIRATVPPDYQTGDHSSVWDSNRLKAASTDVSRNYKCVSQFWISKCKRLHNRACLVELVSPCQHQVFPGGVDNWTQKAITLFSRSSSLLKWPDLT